MDMIVCLLSPSTDEPDEPDSEPETEPEREVARMVDVRVPWRAPVARNWRRSLGSVGNIGYQGTGEEKKDLEDYVNGV
jgi:hypothetical protein